MFCSGCFPKIGDCSIVLVLDSPSLGCLWTIGDTSVVEVDVNPDSCAGVKVRLAWCMWKMIILSYIAPCTHFIRSL